MTHWDRFCNLEKKEKRERKGGGGYLYFVIVMAVTSHGFLNTLKPE